MGTLEATWQDVQITGPENAAAELKRYVQSVDPQSGVCNLVYRLGNLKSMLQLDFREGKVYHYGFDHRPATEPLKQALQATFPQLDLDKHFIDISGRQRTQLAHDSTLSDYQIKEPALALPSEALLRISAYRKANTPAQGLLRSHGMWKKTTQNVLTIPSKQAALSLPTSFSHKS